MGSDDTFEYCGHRGPGGWLCLLAKGHEGHHMSIRNNLMWKGTPGRPVFWPQDAAPGLTREQTDEVELVTRPTLTTAEIASADPTEARVRRTPLVAPAPPDPPASVPTPLAVVPQNRPKFTGIPCSNCNSMNTIQTGKCRYCLDCHSNGECG